ncbi:putative RNA helicase [Helianthus anomalus]
MLKIDLVKWRCSGYWRCRCLKTRSSNGSFRIFELSCTRYPHQYITDGVLLCETLKDVDLDKYWSHWFKTLKTLKIRFTSCGLDLDIVRKAIRSDHFHNVARLKGVGEYVNCRNGMSCHMHPSTTLYGLTDKSDYVVNHELIPTTKEYLQYMTSVEP